MLQLPTNHVHYYMQVNTKEHVTNQYTTEAKKIDISYDTGIN